MAKPNIGDVVKLQDTQTEPFQQDEWRVVAIHDSIDVWWDTPTGESKMALEEALEVYGPEKAATAEWYAELVSVTVDGESLAVASFEIVGY